VVIAWGFARIHWQNLVNFGVLPLTLADALAYDRIEIGDVLKLRAIRRQIRESPQIEAENITRRHVFPLHHELSGRQVTCCSRRHHQLVERSWWRAAPGSPVRKRPLAVTRVR
jgi:3-isopropylmalate dehydratase small subunit